MDIVADTNILILFFRQNPIYDIISNSALYNLKLFVPDLAIEELKKNKEAILKYTNKTKEEVTKLTEKLKSNLIIINKKYFWHYENEAKSLVPHEKDIPFFALALYLQAPIWSNELAFQNQSKMFRNYS